MRKNSIYILIMLIVVVVGITSACANGQTPTAPDELTATDSGNTLVSSDAVIA